MKDVFNAWRFEQNPYLIKSAKAGGRFFNPNCSYQNISTELRKLLLINDEKTAEIDLSAASLQFLNIAIKKYYSGHKGLNDQLNLDNFFIRDFSPEKYLKELSEIFKLREENNDPNDEIFINVIWNRDSATFKKDFLENALYTVSYLKQIINFSDPYEFFLKRINSEERGLFKLEEDLTRDNIKELIYTLIFSQKEKEKNNINRKIRELGKEFDYDRFNYGFKDFFGALKFFKNNVEVPHIGIFKEESNYAQKVLEEGCLKQEIPILPLHDSFIVPISKIDNLEEIIVKTSTDLYGKPLLYKRKY
jgi:hypothetical protein